MTMALFSDNLNFTDQGLYKQLTSFMSLKGYYLKKLLKRVQCHKTIVNEFVSLIY